MPTPQSFREWWERYSPGTKPGPVKVQFEHVELVLNEDTQKWIEQEQQSRWNWLWWPVALVALFVAVVLAIGFACFWRPDK